MSVAEEVESWEGGPVDEWRRSWSLPRLHIVRTTASTNEDLRALAEQGAPAGTVVMAEHQTAGRGRQGRSWHDAPGTSILFSVLLRPAPVRDPAPGTAPLRVGLAAARAIRASCTIDVRIKWPNDLVCENRKLAGILCEAATGGGSVSLVAGVGINVRTAAETPAELAGVATSLDAESERSIDRGKVMTAILAELRPLFDRPLTPLTAEELEDYRRLDALDGRRVSLSGDPRHDTGTARGIAPDGALLLETGGTIVRITSATVRRHHDNSQPQRS